MRFHKNTFPKRILFCLGMTFCFLVGKTKAQVVVNGKIYETGTEIALEGVSVANKNNQTGELTDRFGYFSIEGKIGDSIEVKLLGYLPKIFAIPSPNPGQKVINQNIFLTIRKFQLPQIQILVRPDYRRDSLLNREENASIFNYKKPKVTTALVNTLFHPLSALDNLTHSARRRRIRDFQDRLETQEQDRFIDARYTRQLVSSLTNLHAQELEAFMKLYRPTFEYIQTVSDYDLFTKIKEDFTDYSQNKSSIQTTSKP